MTPTLPLLAAWRPRWAKSTALHLWLCFSGGSCCRSATPRGSGRIYWQRIRLLFHQEVSAEETTQEGKTNSERVFLRETKLKLSVWKLTEKKQRRGMFAHEGGGTVYSSGSPPFWLVTKNIGGLWMNPRRMCILAHGWRGKKDVWFKKHQKHILFVVTDALGWEPPVCRMSADCTEMPWGVGVQLSVAPCEKCSKMW